MSANDEYPRGWVITSTFAATQVPSITVPATPGVTHILTLARRLDIVTVAGVGANAFNFSAVSGSLTEFLNFGGIIAGSPPGQTFEMPWSGKLAGTFGSSLIVSSNGAVLADTQAILEIQGYDI